MASSSDHRVAVARRRVLAVVTCAASLALSAAAWGQSESADQTPGLLSPTAVPYDIEPPAPETPRLSVPDSAEPKFRLPATEDEVEAAEARTVDLADLERVAATEADGPVFTVTSFRVMFMNRLPEHPDPSELERLSVPLALSETGWVVPGEDRPAVAVPLSAAPTLAEQQFHQSALEQVLFALRDELNARGIIGVRVLPGVRKPPAEPQFAFYRSEDDPQRIVWEDARDGATHMVLLVQTAEVGTVRTLAAGDRIPTEKRLNHPSHDWIRDSSPLQPGWLLTRPNLDDYLATLNRHPGRTVDAAVSAGAEPGEATLDYLVYESKPWLVFGQVSNTGTDSTGEIRYAAGVYLNQLTGADDTLLAQFNTPDFDQTQAAVVRYVRPLIKPNKLYVELEGDWSKYTAEDVGLPGASFSGRSWSAGGLIGKNLMQFDELFIDGLIGGRYEQVHVDNQLTATEGEEDFVILSAGLGLSRESEVSNLSARAMIDWNFRSLADTGENTVSRLGRFDADAEFIALRWEATQGFYLEPILAPKKFLDREDPAWSTLAHELRFGFRGQWAFLDDRLVPSQTMAAGGLYSVRGYNEAEIAGDTVLIGSAEYRFHLPRVFRPDPEPPEIFGSPFRFAPTQAYGQPDWDLVLAGFVDYASVKFNRALPFEEDAELLGAGVGVEFSFKRYLTARVDYGYALKDAGETETGDSRVHFLVTVLY